MNCQTRKQHRTKIHMMAWLSLHKVTKIPTIQHKLSCKSLAPCQRTTRNVSSHYYYLVSTAFLDCLSYSGKDDLQFTKWIKWWSICTLTAYSDYTQQQFFPPSAEVAITPCNCIIKDVVQFSIDHADARISAVSALPPLMSLLSVMLCRL